MKPDWVNPNVTAGQIRPSRKSSHPITFNELLDIAVSAYWRNRPDVRK